MAMKIKFDSTRNPISPVIVLATKSGERIGAIPAGNIIAQDSMNNGGSLSFTVNKVDVKLQETWDAISDFKTVWVKDWNQFFEIAVKTSESNALEKNVSATSLGYAELSQINLYGVEINTEDDIDRDDYIPTILYNEEKPEASLLDRLLEKAPHYRIGHVDTSIAHLQRSFSFDKKSITDAFNEVAEELECLFVYNCYLDEDANLIREVNVYDLKDYCPECGTRGTFETACSECGSTNIVPGYGDDTTIFVSSDNLAEEITISVETGSVKNCFKLEAGDDLMTATIANCNPNGSSYIWYLPDTVRKDMSEALAQKLAEYDADYLQYQNDHEFELEGYAFDRYNEIAEKYASDNLSVGKLSETLVGYPAVVKAYYDSIDFALYLTNGMMPSAELIETTAELEAAKLNVSSMATAAVKSLKSASKTSVDNTVLSKAKSIIDRRFTVSITTSTYGDGVWSGIFAVTNTANSEDTSNTDTLLIEINEEYEAYVKQKIDNLLGNKLDNSDTFSVKGIFDLDDDAFKAEMKKYCLNQLSRFYEICQSCIDIMVEQGIANKNTSEISKDELYDKLYLPMVNKLEYIDLETKEREGEISVIKGKFDADGNIEEDGMQTILLRNINEVRDRLNMESYLGTELWSELLTFRREDTYSNSNYISDGLTNEELMQYASEFLRVAREDIIKSATMQHSISATLKNLLVMKEFAPIVDNFKVGNWIRVRIDGKIYRLRLLDYEVRFDDLSNISVSFSDVTYLKDGISDLESVLKSASSMATSYGAVTRQAKSGKESNDAINDWVDNGLAITKVKIIDNVDNQNIKWDDHGFLCRRYMPELDDYDDRQLKILNNGLYMTDDSWKTARAGIGEFTYYNPTTGKMEQSFGVIADTIVGNIILSKNVGVYNEENSVAIDKSGVTITTNGDLNTDKPQTLFTIQKKTTNENGTEKLTKMLYINDAGEVVLNGSVKVLSGSDYTSFDDFTSISKQLVDYQTELGQYLDYGENGLILGAANSPFRTAITNDALRFLDGEYTVAYISNKSLKIQNATIENSLVFGKLTIMPRDGGASIMWAESEGD